MIANWIVWFIALFQTMVEWLSQMEIVGVPVLWIIGASFLMGVFVRAILIKP